MSTLSSSTNPKVKVNEKSKVKVYKNQEEQLLASKYQKKTDIEHILHAPDTYIGSVEKIIANMWVFNSNHYKSIESIKDTSDTKSLSLSDKSNIQPQGEYTPYIIEKSIEYIPGLYKLFDEAIVNARDHVIRMKQLIEKNTDPNALLVNNIEVSITEDGIITIMNDGKGIDVAKHPDDPEIWIPELIFGHLRTSTNYDKEEKKIIGGKNGFGFKLVLIWSTFGSIETVDHVRRLKYYQEFKNNLNEICVPTITKTGAKDKAYTRITFKPDYARLGIPEGLTSDMIDLFKKRVFDIAGITNEKNLKVKYNEMFCPIKNFQQYIDLYIGQKTVTPRVYEETGERWEYAVALSAHTNTHEFQQISFVNGIHTSKGGEHVKYIIGQITKKMTEFILKKKKMQVNPASIKEQLVLFLRCDIENPAFDSQTKDYMNTPAVKFGSKCEVTDKFIEKLAKMGVMEVACAISDSKELKQVQKTDGKKTKTIRGIPKLVDANWAGTDRSQECDLYLCEGDSAKAGVVSGLSSESRNRIGVYPLKGKPMNVNDVILKKIMENKEVSEIKQILGLEMNREYTNIEDVNKRLRYGRIIFLCDQDTDGSHIKGLCINLFHSLWPSLARIPGFICFMNTPILKAYRGQQTLLFYNQGEYETWQQENQAVSHLWTIKYYKGLGTSTAKEFKEYFQTQKLVKFIHTGEQSDEKIDMVFNKKKAEERKLWLADYDRESYLDTAKQQIPYEEFIQKELIHFSKYDNDRSIPNIMDGLKTSLRKILYAAFKRGLTHEIKVAQFSGYVSEHASYHHGEASLNGAIIGMAQNYVGSNNINLLMPNGQFGTRLCNGKDSASERYIFTQLSKITRTLFPAADDAILEYLQDDGSLVEPIYYVPIIPMILVNGSKGIGTGFSTEILSYHPLQISQYIKQKLANQTAATDIIFEPYYEGFKGSIQKINDKKFLIKGKYTKIAEDTIQITELPIGFAIEDFNEHLEELLSPTQKDKKDDKPTKKSKGGSLDILVKDKSNHSTDCVIQFTVQFQKGKLLELENEKLENDINGVEKLLKLTTTVSTTNMHLFDAKDKLKKYDSVIDIIDDYYETRLNYYVKRKTHLIQVLENELMVLSNKARFIQENLTGSIDLRKKTKDAINTILKDKKFDLIAGVGKTGDYNYLVKMPMDSVSAENVEKLLKEKGEKELELEIIKMNSINQMWMIELEKFEEVYKEFIVERNLANVSVSDENNKIGKKKVIKKVLKVVS